MKLTATRIQNPAAALNITFVASHVTPLGAYDGDNFYPADKFTFTRALPFTCPTEREIEELEYRIAHQIESAHQRELWGLVK